MAKTRLPIVQKRIEELLRLQDEPIFLSALHTIYKSEYKETLNVKSLGFDKMKSLVATIPSLGYLKSNNQLVIYLIDDDSTTTTPSSSPTSISTGSSSSFSCSTHSSYTYEKPSQFIGPSRNKSARDGQFLATKEESASDSQSQVLLDKSISFRSDKNSEQEKVDVSSLLTQPAAKNVSAMKSQRASLGDKSIVECFEEMSLLGHVDSNDGTPQAEKPVFLNTHQPFCLTAVGVQGAGKSHSLACVLESCLVQCDSEQVTRLQKPMTALVLHYDQNTTAVCEAAGLLLPSPKIKQTACVPKSKAVVVVSPTFYKQRKKFYGEFCTVRPLLFKWHSLTADHIKRIMRIGPNDNQLYVASFMTLLRRYQRQAVVPDFSKFIEEVKEACNVKGQSGPLDQRIALLESMVAEADVNKEIAKESMDLEKALDSELNLVIADLTDPLLSKEEANCLFQVLTEQFRSVPVQGGKVLALDEAHKFMDGIQSDGLSEAIVNVARLMRHDGMRLIVSTQSPKALAPELLELVSVAILHHFHSKDWWTYLKQKLPLPEEAWETILSLSPGSAIAFASRSALMNASSHVLQLYVRPRLTADLGGSRTNQ